MVDMLIYYNPLQSYMVGSVVWGKAVMVDWWGLGGG
jgi:hypothetical protein